MRAVIGIGANLGERLATMRAAVLAIRAVARVEAASRVYETSPVGGPPQPDYLNAAILVSTEATPEELLASLQGTEAALGRVRRERWGPRAIDLDVLWIEGLAVETERLVVPHPRLHERAFALVPLLEVAPDARDPRTGEPMVAPPSADLRATDERLF